MNVDNRQERHSDLSSAFFQRATSFKVGRLKDREKTIKRRISVCTYPSSEQRKRDQWTLWPHKKPYLWTILNESGAHPYRSIAVQALMPEDIQRRYDFCNFIMNRLQIQTTFLVNIIWPFRVILCTISKTSIPGHWKILDVLTKFVIKYAGR